MEIRERKREKAITLIALIITIIVLLILVSISVSLLTGKTKLLGNAKSAKKQAKIGELQETLDLNKTEYQMDNYDKEISIDKFMDFLDDKEIIEKETDVEVVENNENARYVTLEEKYVFVVEVEPFPSKIINITYEGEVEELKPSIIVKNISNTTSKIELNIETQRNLNGELQYWIKEEGEDENKYQLIRKGKNEDTKSCEFINLKQTTKYNIKIVAIPKNNRKSELVIERTTNEVPNLTEENIKFIYSTSDGIIDKDMWTNKDVKVTAETDITGFTLQTSMDGKKWDNVDNKLFTENGTMYVVLYDGTNYGGSATANVTNIEKVKPIITDVTSTTNSITIKATDEKTGIVGYAITKENEEPTDYISCKNTKELNETVKEQVHGTTYYVWVKDAAGNVSDSKYIITKNVNGLTEANTTFIYSTSDGIIDKNTWTNKDVTVTAKTDITGFALKTSKDGKNWEIKDNQLYTENGTMYAALYDGTNYGESSAANVTNIDKQMPTATIVMDSTATCVDANITAAITMDDKQSGINLSKCKWVYNTTASKIGTSESLYTGGTFSSKSQTINLKATTTGTYYLHILIADNAGNSEEIIADKSVEITDHTYTTSTISASCTSGGYVLHRCSKCGTSYTDSHTSSLGHSYYSYSSSSATCTSSGYTTYRCSRCGDTYSSTTSSALGHNYTSTVTSPTCTSGGYTTHTCSRCGNTYTDSATAKKGHSWGSWSTTKAATCTAEGTKKRTCKNCGKAETGTIEAKGHSYSAATCTKPKTCSRCGATSGSKLHHKYSAATCTKPETCSRCGATSGSKLGHNWGSWSTTKSATCTSAGTKKRKCSRCSATDSSSISALGHNWGSWSTTKSATCTSAGTKKRKCSRCSATDSSSISALGHNWVYIGKGHAQCSRCGQKDMASK